MRCLQYLPVNTHCTGIIPNILQLPDILSADCIIKHLVNMDSAADILKHLPGDYHHVFDLVHFILCIQGDRADLGEG